jgi:8-oxo-dGTP pyrophosphatase MutT (NUDIX family)
VTGTPKHSVSVAGVVLDEAGHVLVVQRRDNKHWEPPGGVSEQAETFDEGVRREVLEETGVAVAVERLTRAYRNMSGGVGALVFRAVGPGQVGNGRGPTTGFITIVEDRRSTVGRVASLSSNNRWYASRSAVTTRSR